MGIRQFLRERCPWKFVRSPFLRYFAFQDPIDCIFYAYSLDRQPFFIQIGSNDGVNGDPIYEFILNWNWSGIKVEPVRYVFEKLEKNFRDFPNIILENSAIASLTAGTVEESSSQKFYYLRQDEIAPEWYSQLGSFSLATILKHEQWIPDLQERLITSDVACLSFNQLCHKYNVDHIDIIHIDTEGYDFEIIKLIDFEKFTPSIVLYEHKHLSTSDQAACRQHLANFGYQFVSTKRDTLAVLDSDRVRQAWKIAAGSR